MAQNAYVDMLKELQHTREEIFAGRGHDYEFSIDNEVRMAYLNAEQSFKERPVMPENVEVAIRFPGVDPSGNYSVIDMKFAQRRAAVEAALESRSPEVQAYAKGLLGKCTDDTYPHSKFYEAYYEMKDSAEKHRNLTRAAKLAERPDAKRLLHVQARAREVRDEVVDFDKLMQGIEYAAGVRTGPVPREVTDYYHKELHTDLDLGMVHAAQTVYQPAKMAVNFQDFDHMMLHRAYADPDNWDRSTQALDAIADAMDPDTYAHALRPYALATADRVIDPAFKDIERTSGGHLSRGDLIIIDGQTVRQRVFADYMRTEGNSRNFDQFFEKNMQRLTNEYVSAGLMAGKRVEAFVPDKNGQIPKEPTQITKEGYEPSPLKPEKFNAWQRFFAKRGYYKKKVARQEEYERLMAAREQVRAQAEANAERAGEVIGENRLAQMKAVVDRSEALSCASTAVKTMFFGKVMDEIAPELEKMNAEYWKYQGKSPEDHPVRTFTTDDSGRTTREYTYNAWEMMKSKIGADFSAKGSFVAFTRSEAAETCVCSLLAQGYKFRDIMDPAKLADQRDAAAREFLAHARTNDQEWLGRVYYAGQKEILKQTAELTQGVDLKGDDILPVLAEAQEMLHVGFGVSQTLANAGCKEGFLMAGCEEAVKHAFPADQCRSVDLERGSQMAEALNEKICQVGLCTDYLLNGVKAQLKLADPAAPVSATELGQVVGMKLLQEGLGPGTSLVDRVQMSNDLITKVDIAATMSAMDTEGENTLGRIGKDMLQDRAALARDAASGKLQSTLNGKVRSVQAVKNGKPLTTNTAAFKDALVRNANGKLEKQRTYVESPITEPIFSFAAGKEPPEPKNPYAPQAPQRGHQRHAPQKKAPQMNGPKR